MCGNGLVWGSENYERALDALLATGADVLTANLFDVGLTPWVHQLNPNFSDELLATSSTATGPTPPVGRAPGLR